MSIESWVEGNIFDYKKFDGVAYLVFYILIPVIVTVVSLEVLSTEDIAVAYCYMTIMISSLNCIYDAGNRWNSGNKSIRNTKIFLMCISNVIICAYCFCVIMYILIGLDIEKMYRCDWILLTYFVVIAIAIYDIVGCFAKDMALKVCIEQGDDEK